MPDKSQEHRYLVALRESCSDFPVGEIEPCERPDFLVHSDPKTIGVEFTTFHLPPSAGEKPHQEIQALKDRIVTHAAALHDASGGAPLYVSIVFRPRVVLRKTSVPSIATKIVEAVSAVSGRTLASDSDVRANWEDLPEEVVDVMVRRSINGVDKLWHADAGGWVASITPEHISSVLQTKIAMHSAARGRCDELWLVVVNDLFSRAAQAELAESTVEAVFEHPFDRLLWLIPHVPRVIQLKSSTAA